MLSNMLREQISAFMDGELPQEESALLLKRFANNREVGRCWQHYHLIGDALRDELAPEIARDMTPGVGRALEKPAARSRLRRLTTLAAGVAVIGLAGVVGGLVSHQIEGGGKVFAPGRGGSLQQSILPRQVDWRQTPSPVQVELSRYLLLHDLYAPQPHVPASPAGSPVTSANPSGALHQQAVRH